MHLVYGFDIYIRALRDKQQSFLLPFTHLPPETVDTVKLVAWSGSIMDGCVSTIAFHAQAALIAAGMPPPEKAIPIDMMLFA